MAVAPAVRARMRLEGEVQLEYLQKHIAEWAEKQPQLVEAALFHGANMLRDAVREEMNKQLRRRTGELDRALWREVVHLPGGIVDAEVFVKPGAGNLQPVKLRALELGSYRRHPGGIPYIFIAGKPRWITKEEAESRERQGLHVLRTKGPYGIRVGKRPMFGPALRKNRIKLAQMVLREIIEGFKREQAKGAA